MLRSYTSHPFPHPQNQRCSADDNSPIGKFQWDDVKHLTANGYYQPLTDKDDQRDSEENAAFSQRRECRFSRHKCFGVEHIPKLKHDEYREECVLCQKKAVSYVAYSYKE